jgi:hypothetical protein
MQRFRAVLIFCLFLCSSVFSEERGTIQCDPGSTGHIPAWIAPGRAYVVEQLNCGQFISVVGLERGYVKIQIGNQFAYVDAKYVRLTQIDEQRTPPVQPNQSKPTSQTTNAGKSQPDLKRTSDVTLTHPRVEIFGGFNWVSLTDYVLIRRGPSYWDVKYTGKLDGWIASVAVNLHRAFGIKGEFSGIYGKGRSGAYHNIDLKDYSFLAGPQATARTGFIDVFGHALLALRGDRVSFLYLIQQIIWRKLLFQWLWAGD